jgi:Co/Zn/Cd efflux system component
VTSFVAFHLYVILALSCLIVAVQALLRRDYETPGAMLIVFLCSLIGLSNNYYQFIRVFSGIYGIEWGG